jgi:polyhydroxyalkanoate synthesis repressor PhaR
MAKPLIVIKKYENRRLYDTSSSRYVNLDDVAAMIREGREVQVLDAKSGEDLTRVTLTQIITEDAKDQPAGLPLELLRQLIIATDKAGQEFVMSYLKSAFDTYQKVRDVVQNRFSEMQSSALSPLQIMSNFIPGSQTQRPSGAEPDSELLELRRRLAELEARVHKRKAPRRRAKRAGAPPRRRSQ